MPFCAGFGRICARWGSNFCRNSRRFHRSCNNSPPLGDGLFGTAELPSDPMGAGPHRPGESPAPDVIDAARQDPSRRGRV